MIEIVQTGQTGKTNLLFDMHRLRARVFREKMKWDVNVTPENLEIDQFDLPDTVYLLALNDNGRKILVPKGATLMLCTHSVHRRDVYWEDPESFYPERFTPEEIAKRPKLSWFPFGGGPRLCLGFKFAEVESVMALAKVYQNYDLRLIPDQHIKPDPIITLRPDRPVMFRIKKR